MDNGPKPTHLWHLTGRKHFNRIISDRIEGIKWLHPMGGRSRKDMAQLVFLTIALTAIGAYTMGSLNLKKFYEYDNDDLMDPEADCTTKTGMKCPKSKADSLPPCPCVEDDKCPMEWMKEEEKHRRQS